MEHVHWAWLIVTGFAGFGLGVGAVVGAVLVKWVRIQSGMGDDSEP